MFRTRFCQFDNTDQQDAHEALMCMLDLLEPIIKPIINCRLVQETVCTSGKNVVKDETMILTLPPKDTLEKSLEAFAEWHAIENYEDQNKKVWNVAATRTMFEQFPKVLILSLTHKQTIQVSEHLNKYKLFASCVHVGSQRGGHYMAYTKHKGKWYLKDDLQCVECEFPETSGHCILFYKLG
jgi:ubiquitin C-terminal hydrolase